MNTSSWNNQSLVFLYFFQSSWGVIVAIDVVEDDIVVISGAEKPRSNVKNTLQGAVLNVRTGVLRKFSPLKHMTFERENCIKNGRFLRLKVPSRIEEMEEGRQAHEYSVRCATKAGGQQMHACAARCVASPFLPLLLCSINLPARQMRELHGAINN